MERKIKVLHIVGALNLGGAETMIVNIMRNIDRSIFQFDFYLSGNKDGFYEKEVLALGGRIFNVGHRKKHPFKYCVQLIKLIHREKYDCIQIHATNSLDGLPAMITKIGGAKRVCMFSHCSGGIKIDVQKLLRVIFNPFIDEKQACSDLAAEWMYGKAAKNAAIIPLPIDCAACRFDGKVALKKRNEYGFENNKVLGHIGRFYPQKNHTRLVEIFYELVHRDDNWRLVLIGGGPLLGEIKIKVNALGIEDKVFFLGEFSQACRELSIFDVMILPSHYEGFPTVLLEAQANGLPCVAATTITKTISLTDLVSFVDLECSNEIWGDKIDTLCIRREKTDLYNRQIAQIYDIEIVTERFAAIYIAK